MIIVSNTSPIINLAAIGELEILRAVYQQIQIPVAVYQEITRFGDTLPGAREVRLVNWIRTTAVQNTQARQMINLDPGEAEALVLAQELKADYLLIDERRGRKLATKLGLPIIGTIGTVHLAKREGIVTAIRPILDALIVQAGFRVSRDLYERILAEADE